MGDVDAPEVPEQAAVTEPADEDTSPSTESADTGLPMPDASTLPEAPAPGELGSATLPDDADAVAALFGALPDALLDGRLAVDSTMRERLVAIYETGDRQCGDIGFQAVDVASGLGPYPADWRAEHVVALFAGGADWDVEVAGHEGARYWVTLETTCGGEGIEDEVVATAVWGDAGSPWVFFATAPDVAGRATLLTAFVEAAAA